MILLVLLTMAPDADFVLHYISDTTYLQYHRGITHSMLMLPLWTWMFYSLLPLKRTANRLAPWLIGAAIAMHIGLDLITSFGTMVFAPVSDWRAALDLVFIIDPLFTACLLLPLLMTILWRKQARTLACTALFLAGSYLGLSAWTHAQAMQLVRQEQPGAQDYAALPLPFSPFHWQLIATWPNHYTRSAVNLFPDFTGSAPFFSQAFIARYMPHLQPPDRLNWQKLPAMPAANDLDKLPGVTFYRWFARFPVLLEQDDKHMEFGDLRFGAGVEGSESPFRLYIELGHTPAAWLIWREGQRSALE